MQADARRADVVMLGLPGFRVLEAVDVDGELETLVETTAGRDWCRACGVLARSHARREVLVRDVDAFGRPARLRWRKRVWRCPESADDVRLGAAVFLEVEYLPQSGLGRSR